MPVRCDHDGRNAQSETFDELIDACDIALAQGSVDDVSRALSNLNEAYPAEADFDAVQLCRLASALIDAGSTVAGLEHVERGTRIFKDHWDALLPRYGQATLHYNLANGYKAQFDIQRKASGWEFSPASCEMLLRAKGHYWKSLATTPPAQPRPEQLTNLANALSNSGRVVDALRVLDSLLKRHPDFGMAHINRAQMLQWLSRLSGGYSIKLLYEIHRAFDSANRAVEVARSTRETAKASASRIADILGKHGHGTTEDPHSEAQTAEAFASHDAYWRWCLDQSLALCEHSLYCRCEGARRDDLSILSSKQPLTGELVPRMELLLNRLKSEYCLSRALLFQSIQPVPGLAWELGVFEGTFTDLGDDEAIGLVPEFLRTSFRLCFGALDRIARGVCDLFQLASDGESIYFHKFWRGGKGSLRWDTLNRSRNPNLVALYGLARDLSEQANGEWNHLRKYRNLFEHELLLIRSEGSSMELPPWLEGVKSVTFEGMCADALDMLAFTRAAIFQFAFLVRWESQSGVDSEVPVVTFDKKVLGKD